MPNKYQIDRDTKKPNGNETGKEKLERLNKRIAWNLELDGYLFEYLIINLSTKFLTRQR